MPDRPWPPQANELARANAYTFFAVRPKYGKKRESLNKLIESAQIVQSDEGVLQSAVYRNVFGNGPDYMLIFMTKNPGVQSKLGRNRALRKLEEELKGLAKSSRRGNVNTRLTGRLRI